MVRTELKPGLVFGRLTILGDAYRNGYLVWKCLCVCGNVVYPCSSALVYGMTVSCGCSRVEQFIRRNTKHGEGSRKRYSPEYKLWENIKTRCNNRNAPYYKHYGGRGIKICRRWANSFMLFLKDVGRRPGKGYSIDRIDNDGDYKPSNCRWATQKQQLRNRRGNRLVTINGETKTVAEWSEVSGNIPKTIEYRLNTGWDLYDAVFALPYTIVRGHKVKRRRKPTPETD